MTDQQLENPGQPEAVGQAAQPPVAPPPPKASPVPAIVLISVALIGLLVVGYFAWQQGYLGGGSRSEPERRESPVKVVKSGADEDSGGAESGDTLGRLDDDVPGIKPYRGYVKIVREFDQALADVRVATQAPGKLAESTKQQLYALQPLGRDFAAKYSDFEQRAARDRQPKLQPYQEILRAAFVERMVRFVGLIGDAYAAEQDFSHPVFTVSDTFVAVIEQHGAADPEPVRSRWLEAVHAREQAGLSEQYEGEIGALQARIDKLKALHLEVDELLKGAPQYRIRAGIIGSTARNLLEVFDSLASRVEAQVIEFEQYVAGLPDDHGSERIAELIAEFTRLAQEDHFHAFRETYKIYEQDKELEHPVYPRLKDHYEFVKQHWPALAGQYRRQYEQSEGRWASSWAQQ